MTKRNIVMAMIFSVSIIDVALAGPITKVAALSPRYNTEVLEISWDGVVAGGCVYSDFAVTNPAAANHKALVATLLTAFAAGNNVEVIFGGGCDSGSVNWIQTIKILR